MTGTTERVGRWARHLSVRVVGVFVLLAISLGAAVVPTGAAVHAGTTRASDHQATVPCPIAGQCDVNPATDCPVQGPLQATPPQKCVGLGTRVFYVSATVNGGCATELLVRVRVPATLTEYEAVVYSQIGEGTRWWSTPDRNGNGTGWGPGEKVTAYGAVSYTVPPGFHAWQVGGGTSGSPCAPGSRTKTWVGKGAWAVVTPTLAGNGTLSIHGPTTNARNSHFNETISGTASGGANYVIAGEQLNPEGGCAATPAAEAAKGPLDWMQWPTGNGPVSGHFSLVAKFDAVNGGKHGMCAYLVNHVTQQVYARAAQWWTNIEVAHPVPGSGTIGITGPTQNAYHAQFNETVSGTASGGANYVISGEQTTQFGGCASTYLTESQKGSWVRWPTGTGAVHGNFTLVAKFMAQNHNSHAICSYLVNATTKQTYAFASHFWSNS